jgi:hypothetical protein
MHKNAMKCNETQGKWCRNKHGASKIIDTFETYHPPPPTVLHDLQNQTLTIEQRDRIPPPRRRRSRRRERGPAKHRGDRMEKADMGPPANKESYLLYRYIF